MSSIFPDSNIIECSHCGNRTPHTRMLEYRHLMLFDETDTGKMYEPYTWLGYSCSTCGGLSIYGAFFEVDTDPAQLKRTRLHPRGADLLPPAHMMSPSQPVPFRVLAQYEEIWPLRHRVPTAFIGQIRRLLEFVCADQGATGKDLFEKLKDLSTKGILPGYFNQITTLLRRVGNMGAHAADVELSVWDAELIDDFFRSVLEYVYIAPAKIRRMETRLKSHEQSTVEET